MIADITRLVVNWHFINHCDMACRFCFADKHLCNKRSRGAMLDMVEKLSIFERINFVGGEPTLHPYFREMTARARVLGTKVSVVTNGLCAIKKPALFNQCFSGMDKVGLSIDSLNPDINRFTGRASGGEVLSAKSALEFCRRIKDLGVSLKINTVVHQANKNEDFNDFISRIQPDQWKIFQVLPVGKSQGYKDLLISGEEFNAFLQRHASFGDIICDETKDLMRDSYIMVNSEGYFMKTSPYAIQPFQHSLFEKDTDTASEFLCMGYDLAKYNTRYRRAVS